jgi:uncharacterized membrane protein
MFLLFMLIDGVWLFSMGPTFYRHYLGYLFADSFQYSWAILFYILYAIAVTQFVFVPYVIKSEISVQQLFLQAFFFGLVVYSAYDLTNQATIKNWPLIVTVVDMLWGASLTGMVVVLASKFIK